jgi:hypothetical protein
VEHGERDVPLTILNDNKSAVGAYWRGYSEKLAVYSKAVGLKLRLCKDLMAAGMIYIGRVGTLLDAADGHTKALERLKFQQSRLMMGVREVPLGPEAEECEEMMRGPTWVGTDVPTAAALKARGMRAPRA